MPVVLINSALTPVAAAQAAAFGASAFAAPVLQYLTDFNTTVYGTSVPTTLSSHALRFGYEVSRAYSSAHISNWDIGVRGVRVGISASTFTQSDSEITSMSADRVGVIVANIAAAVLFGGGVPSLDLLPEKLRQSAFGDHLGMFETARNVNKGDPRVLFRVHDAKTIFVEARSDIHIRNLLADGVESMIERTYRFTFDDGREWKRNEVLQESAVNIARGMTRSASLVRSCDSIIVDVRDSSNDVAKLYLPFGRVPEPNIKFVGNGRNSPLTIIARRCNLGYSVPFFVDYRVTSDFLVFGKKRSGFTVRVEPDGLIDSPIELSIRYRVALR